jgi:hypothetical protein
MQTNPFYLEADSKKHEELVQITKGIRFLGEELISGKDSTWSGYLPEPRLRVRVRNREKRIAGPGRMMATWGEWKDLARPGQMGNRTGCRSNPNKGTGNLYYFPNH